MMESLVTEYDKTGYIRERTGAILPNVAPSNVYPTSDGLVLIAANQDTVFRRLCEAMGDAGARRRSALREPPGARRAPGGARRADRPLDRRPHDARRARRSWRRHGVPAGQIYRAPEMLEDPHFAAREAIVEVPHPQFGKIRMQNVVPKLSATPGGIRAPSPALGEHNDAIYLDFLGLPRERYAALKAARVI